MNSSNFFALGRRAMRGRDHGVGAVLAARNPINQSASPGKLDARKAHLRKLCKYDPPRQTRQEPSKGPTGSVSGFVPRLHTSQSLHHSITFPAMSESPCAWGAPGCMPAGDV